MLSADENNMLVQTVSVVVPVYLGGTALRSTVQELLDSAASFDIASMVKLELEEVILVVDNPRLSHAERADIRALEDLDRRVHSMWLTRNFGQHPATVAGIVSTNGDWVVTMDEDGQHDPNEIPRMLVTAAERSSTLVYVKPTNPPPHGAARNVASRLAKSLFRWLSGVEEDFHSFRLSRRTPRRRRLRRSARTQVRHRSRLTHIPSISSSNTRTALAWTA